MTPVGTQHDIFGGKTQPRQAKKKTAMKVQQSQILPAKSEERFFSPVQDDLLKMKVFS